MNNQYPPKVLVKNWLELLCKPETTLIRKGLIESNIVRIFGSVELAVVYLESEEIYA